MCVRASNRFQVTFETNRYSVPAEYASQRLPLKAYPDQVCLYAAGQRIARHPRSYDRHGDFEDPDHPKALLAERRNARAQRTLQRFLALSPQAQTYYAELELRRFNAMRHDRSVERRLRLARFPVRKSLEQFDWTWPRKINRLQVQNLFRLQFIELCANVIIVGGVGLGQTHLATALGIAACQQSYSVLFTSAIDAVNTLTASQAAGRLKKDLGKFLRPRVLLLDELGYLPIDKTGADLLFQIISQRYENGSTIITTNRVFKK